jgi:hypothetical protein
MRVGIRQGLDDWGPISHVRGLAQSPVDGWREYRYTFGAAALGRSDP